MNVEWQRLRLAPAAAGGQVRDDRGGLGEGGVVSGEGGVGELRPQFGGERVVIVAEPDGAQAAVRGRDQSHSLRDRGDRPADGLARRPGPVPPRRHAQLAAGGHVRGAR